MADFTPAQAEAIFSLDVNIAVSAGAGAGKTKVLVERYINILKRRLAGCGEILAITFTNKAAKEMRERIRAKADDLSQTAATAAERQLWQAVKGELEYAPIGTFHSFCSRLLRENPVEAAIDPDFSVLDEVENRLLVETALTGVLADGLAGEAGWLELLLSAYGRYMLTGIAPELYERTASLGLLTDGLAEELAAPYQKALAGGAKLREELKSLSLELMAVKNALKPTTANYSRIEKLAANWEEVAAAIDLTGGEDEACYKVLQTYYAGFDRRSKGKELVGAIRDCLTRLERLRADRKALALVPAWRCLLQKLDTALTVIKNERRVLTFTDLEVRSVRLLTGHPAVRDRYVGRIKQIMVDEFQDTNELQRQIVYLVAGGDPHVLRGNKLFIVGDAKQSIYRFRGADVSLFAQVSRDILKAGGKTIELDVNFRSMDGLLTLYNKCFGAIMGTADDSVDFAPLQAKRAEARERQIRAELLLTGGDTPAGEAARRQEALAIAARIRAMVDGAEQLLDHDLAARGVNYGDIAILFRTAKDIELYAAALQQAGVPYYIVGGQGFYHCREILDMLNLLWVVDNRFQETALAGVLRSPLFLLADKTLVYLKEYGGGALWTGLETAAAADGLEEAQRSAALRAWDIINKLRQRRGVLKAADLIGLALEETGYLNFVLTQFMGQQKYANLNKLVALARSFESRGAAALGGFLRYVARLVDSEVKESEAVMENEDGLAVKLMTIHKSKGLEFPVVFLPDLHRKFRDESSPVLFAAKGGLGIKAPVGGRLAPSSHYGKMAAEEKQLAQLELKRLLYVALTRAKDYLVLSGTGGKVSADKGFSELSSWLGWLGRVCGVSELNALPEKIAVEQSEILVRYDVRGCSEAKLAACSVAARADEAALAEIRRNIAPVAGTGAMAGISFSASKADRFRRCPRSFYYSVVAGLPEVTGRAMAAETLAPQLVGTVLHRCLELLNGEAPWRQILAGVVAEKVPAAGREAVLNEAGGLLGRYLAGSFHAKIKALPVKREWEFNYLLPDGETRPGFWFTGSVDCLVDYGDGGFGIIDYKTDNVRKDAIAAKAEEHRLQLLLYVLAVEAATQRPVREAVIYFWRPDTAVQVDITDNDKKAAREELLAVCRFVAARTGERDYVCRTEWCEWCGFNRFCPRL